jgi:hypothetical protein
MLDLSLAGICVCIFGAVWIWIEWLNAKNRAELEFKNRASSNQR